MPEPRLILFANARSGGGAAKTIIAYFSTAIGPEHVYDLSHHDPRDVLRNEFASPASPSTAPTRIIVAGGDGTVTWILATIAALSRDFPGRPRPPVAILPLGTGNDLAINLGWGKTFNASSLKSPKKFQALQERVTSAPTTALDYWNVDFTNFSFPNSGDGDGDGLPHAVVRSSDGPNTSATSKFWNYFSIGLDAQTAYNFHTLREHHPRATSSRLINQAWYGIFTCGTGWFCGGTPLRTHAIKSLRIQKSPGDPFTHTPLPPDIRAIIILNLQTYGGGRDIWAMPNHRNLERKHMVQPSRNDGLIEVIGFRSGWHAAVVMGELATTRVHGKRLGQGCGVEITLQTYGTSSTRERKKRSVCMQLDGEPWKQSLADVDGDGDGGRGEHAREEERERERECRITVSFGGQSAVLNGS